jgi:hypothetical protein
MELLFPHHTKSDSNMPLICHIKPYPIQLYAIDVNVISIIPLKKSLTLQNILETLKAKVISSIKAQINESFILFNQYPTDQYPTASKVFH